METRGNLIYALVVAVEDFRRDLYLGVLGYHLWRYHLWRNLDAVHYLNTALDDSIVLHIRHTNKVVDLRDAEPVQDVRHQSLKAGILHAGDALRTIEIPAEARVSRVDGV